MPIELLKDNLVVRRIGDEYFLLTSGDTMLHNVRGSGVFILEAIENGADYDGILDGLVAEFEVPRDEAAADLDAFLRELEEKEIIAVE